MQILGQDDSLCPSSSRHSPFPAGLNVSVQSSSPRISQQSSNESLNESSVSSSSTHTTTASLPAGGTTTDILARIERTGRALRKSAAIDSEDHVLAPGNPLLHQQPAPIQPPQFQLAGLPATDSLAGKFFGLVTESSFVNCTLKLSMFSGSCPTSTKCKWSYWHSTWSFG